MPQVSQKKLDKTIESEMFTQFWDSISRLKTSSDVSDFFTDILTQTEQVMLTKRFMIAILLGRGKRPIEISQILHVSFSTIGGVASWEKNAKPKTKEIIEMLIAEGNWGSLLDRFEKIMDKLPPGRGTDWHLAGKEKYQRQKERSARNSLR